MRSLLTSHSIRGFVALGFLLLLSAAALAQQTTSPPLPTTTVNVGELVAPWLQTLIGVAVTLLMALLGWLTAIINKKAGLENNAAVLQAEAHMRELLQTAIENAAGKVVMLVGERLKDTKLDLKSPAVAEAVTYVNKAAFDAVQKWGLSGEQLAEKILAKVGILTAANPTVWPTVAPATITAQRP